MKVAWISHMWGSITALYIIYGAASAIHCFVRTGQVVKSGNRHFRWGSSTVTNLSRLATTSPIVKVCHEFDTVLRCQSTITVFVTVCFGHLIYKLFDTTTVVTNSCHSYDNSYYCLNDDASSYILVHWIALKGMSLM